MKQARYEVRKDVNMSTFLSYMLENSQIAAILILDKNGFILDMSHGVKISYGYSLDDIIDKHFSCLYTIEDQKSGKPEKELKDAMDKGYAADNNYIMHKSNEVIWSHGETIFVKNEAKEIYFIKFIYDINQQKLLEKSLVASNTFSYSILETINEALIVLDENLSIKMANASFYKCFHIAEKEIANKSFFEISNASWNIPMLKELLFEILPRNTTIKNYEVEFKLPEGNKVFRLNAQQIFYEGEKLHKILIAFDDFTADKTVKESLSTENVMLNKANKDMDVFIYSASHDLKAPINNIEGLINAISDHPDCSNAITDLIEMMKESIHKFKNTLDDLAKVVHVEQEAKEGVVTIGFKSMLEEVKFNLHAQIEQAGAFISDDFTKAPVINFSRINLRSVLHNLLSNAIKYRSPERVPQIHISTEKTNGYILLQIKDNGLGIKEEDKGKVLAIFERIHSHVEGTGLGMNIVKKIIDLNGGKIQIESQVNVGTTIMVFLKI
jgi:PAS domain S-box-containing protein